MARRNNDLVFIKTDAGTEYGNVYYRVGNAECFKGLRSNLTEALTGYERTALVIARTALGKAHHKYAKKNGEILLLAIITKLLLDMGEGYYVNVHL